MTCIPWLLRGNGSIGAGKIQWVFEIGIEGQMTASAGMVIGRAPRVAARAPEHFPKHFLVQQRAREHFDL